MNYSLDLRGFTELVGRLHDSEIPFKRFSEKTDDCILFRHDIGGNMEAAVKMAKLERTLGVVSTYFILNYSGRSGHYWHKANKMKSIYTIADCGHEIAWHNNAITQHVEVGTPLYECVARPLSVLRGMGFTINGSSAFVDPVRYLGRSAEEKQKYVNYEVFKGVGRKHKEFDKFDMERFDLFWEATFIGHSHYASDPYGKWNKDVGNMLNDFEKSGRVLQMNIHPQWWNI